MGRGLALKLLDVYNWNEVAGCACGSSIGSEKNPASSNCFNWLKGATPIVGYKSFSWVHPLHTVWLTTQEPTDGGSKICHHTPCRSPKVAKASIEIGAVEWATEKQEGFR